MPQTDTANVIPELAGGWNDGLACFIFRFLKRPLAVLPLIPFVFVWAFLVELFRPKHQPPAPIQSATQRTAEVIDLAAWRRRKGKAKE